MPAPSNYLDKTMSLDEAVPRETRFMTKDDCGPGLPVCIDHLTVETIENDKGQLKNKTILHFKHGEKPLILNQTNREALKEIHGKTVGAVLDKWIVVYNDKNVSFGGKRTGGIRIREAQDAEITGKAADRPDEIPF